MNKADMQLQNRRPKWRLLYFIFPVLLALFVLDSRLNISMRGHQIVQIGSLMLTLSLVYIWLKTNTNALSRMDQKKHSGRISGVLYEHENTLPPEKDLYAKFRSRNSYIGGQLNNPVDKDADQTGYSLPEDIRQEMDKE